MATRTWNSPGTDGAWNLAADWMEGAYPVAGDAATITGGLAVMNVSGGGAAASLLDFANTELSAGTFAVQAVTIGSAAQGGYVFLASDGVLAGATASVSNHSSLEVAGRLTLSGMLAVDGGMSIYTPRVLGDSGSTIQVGGVTLAGAYGGSVGAQSGGIFEVGTMGGAAAGNFTVDAGRTVTGNGQLSAAVGIVNNGTITASGGVLSLTDGASSAVSGSGMLDIAAGGRLSLSNGAGAGQTIAFLAGSGELDLSLGASNTTAAPVIGFDATDRIVIGNVGRGTLTVAYARTGVNAQSVPVGTLTVSGAASGTLTMVGDFTGYRFTNSGGTITLSASAGSYVMSGSGTQDWSTAGNWRNLSDNTPAGTSPMSSDTATIKGSNLTVSGTGSAFELDTVAGYSETLAGVFTLNHATLAGTVNVTGALSVTSPSSGLSAPGSVEVKSGGTLTSTDFVQAASGGTLHVDQGGQLLLSGLVTGGNTTHPVGLTVTGAATIDGLVDSSAGLVSAGQSGTSSTASILAENGATGKAAATVLGSSSTAAGSLTLTGMGTTWSNVATPTTGSPFGGTVVGEGSFNAADGNQASLTVYGGALLADAGSSVIADDAHSVGNASIDGGGSWTVAGQLVDGNLGTASLSIDVGGVVRAGGGHANGVSGAVVAAQAGSNGSLSVSGGMLDTRGDRLAVGNAGTASLYVYQSGTVTAGAASYSDGSAGLSVAAVGGSGTISIDGIGGLLSVAGRIDLSGGLAGGGGTANVTATNAALIRATGLQMGVGSQIGTDSTGRIVLGTSAGIAGALTVDAGATLLGAGTITGRVVDAGSVVAEGGTLTLSGVTGAGVLGAVGGTLDVTSTAANSSYAFGGNAATIRVHNDQGARTVVGFTVGDTLDVANNLTATLSGSTLTLSSANVTFATYSFANLASGTILAVTPRMMGMGETITATNPTATVTGIYADVLGRAPTSMELASQIQSLGSGNTAAQIRSALAAGTEAQAALNAVYVSEDGRNATSGELAFLTSYVQGGGTLAQVRTATATYPEAQAALNQVYLNEDGRAASAFELSTLTGYLQGGGTLAQVRAATATYPEAQAALNRIYLDEDGRAATTGELSILTGYLQQGLSLAQIQYATATYPEAQAALKAIYANELNRAPSAGELSTLTGFLQQGLSLAQIQSATATFPEAQADLKALYEAELGRDPTAGELPILTGELQAGVSLAQIRTATATYPEAQADLAQIYQSELGRAPNAGEASILTGYLQQGFSLAQIRAGTATLPEAQADLKALYNAVLDRAPTAGELPFLTSELQQGSTLAQIRAATASFPEAQADIAQVYRDVLNRAPSTAELNLATANLGSTASLENIRQGLAQGTEGRADVTSLETSALGHAPTAAQFNDGLLALSCGVTQAGLTFQTLALASSPTILTDTTGSGVLTGTAGVDEFNFSNPGYAFDIVVGFDPKHDLINVNSAVIPNYAAFLQHVATAQFGTQVTIDSSHSFLLQSVTPSNLSSGNVHFL